MSYVVVGYDGSAGSVEALRWTFAEANVRARPVVVISVLEPRPVPSIWTASVRTPPSVEELAQAQQRAEEAVGKVAADVGLTQPVEVSVRVGHAGPTLVQAAADADLLVVGSHGYSALERAVLGSVSTFAVHHARCPVVVIRSAG
jgi:nucleotide-binding universal stress UspA family protein